MKGETLYTTKETYEFQHKHLSPLIIFVSPVIINFQNGKICYDRRFLSSLCILLPLYSLICLGRNVRLWYGTVAVFFSKFCALLSACSLRSEYRYTLLKRELTYNIFYLIGVNGEIQNNYLSWYLSGKKILLITIDSPGNSYHWQF